MCAQWLVLYVYKEFISTYAFVAFTALLSDALCVVTALSKKFQTESMDVSAVNVHVNVALASLQGMKVEADTYLDEFFKATAFDSSSYKGNALINSNDTSKQEFLELRDSYLDSLIDHLQERLCNDSTEVLDTFSLLEPNMAVSITLEERARLCNVLHAHFKIRPEERLVDVAPSVFVDVPALKKELVKLTPLMSGCYSGLRFDGLARMLLIRHGGDYPQACRLAEIGLCMPVSTASCERGFSLQNRIKVKSNLIWI